MDFSYFFGLDRRKCLAWDGECLVVPTAAVCHSLSKTQRLQNAVVGACAHSLGPPVVPFLTPFLVGRVEFSNLSNLEDLVEAYQRLCVSTSERPWLEPLLIAASVQRSPGASSLVVCSFLHHGSEAQTGGERVRP